MIANRQVNLLWIKVYGYGSRLSVLMSRIKIEEELRIKDSHLVGF